MRKASCWALLAVREGLDAGRPAEAAEFPNGLADRLDAVAAALADGGRIRVAPAPAPAGDDAPRRRAAFRRTAGSRPPNGASRAVGPGWRRAPGPEEVGFQPSFWLRQLRDNLTKRIPVPRRDAARFALTGARP